MRKYRPLFSILITLIICLNLAGTSLAQSAQDDVPLAAKLLRWSAAPDAPDAVLQKMLEQMTAKLDGDWQVAVKKLDTGEIASVNGNRQFVSASLYKLGVLLTLATLHAQGKLSYTDYAKVIAADNFEEYNIPVGTQLSLQRAAELMIDQSNNTAASLLIRVVGGQAVINSVLQDYGLSRTLFDPNNDNLTCANDMMRYFEMLYSARLVNPDESQWMLDILLRQEINDLIPPNIPDGVPTAHKTGNLDGLLHDAGIVYSPSGAFVIVVMAQNMDNEQTARTNTPKIAKAVFDYLNRDTHPAHSFSETGHMVSGLFLKFWNTWGGLRQFGYPISDALLQDGLQVQYFERARFEYHPDNADAPVQLTLLGSDIVAARGYDTTPTSPSRDKSNVYFPTTGHNLSRSFLTYWRTHGGITVYGYPLTERFQETSATDGKKYVVQYFQRARLELHADAGSDPYVLLGPIGSEGMQIHQQSSEQHTMTVLFDTVLKIGSI